MIISYLSLCFFSLCQTNTFQCIITSNAEQSYVLFYYADGLIQWANPFFTEDEIPAYPLAGINSGERFEVVTGSRSPAIINVDTTSNVGVGGVWAFRLDTIEVPMVACDDRSKWAFPTVEFEK